jgi:LysM repeat protein
VLYILHHEETVPAFLARLSPRGSCSTVVSRAVVTSTMSGHTLQAGDTFSTIAAKLGTTLAAIEQANPGISPTSLQVGQVLQLKVRDQRILYKLGTHSVPLHSSLGSLSRL